MIVSRWRTFTAAVHPAPVSRLGLSINIFVWRGFLYQQIDINTSKKDEEDEYRMKSGKREKGKGNNGSDLRAVAFAKRSRAAHTPAMMLVTSRLLSPNPEKTSLTTHNDLWKWLSFLLLLLRHHRRPFEKERKKKKGRRLTLILPFPHIYIYLAVYGYSEYYPTLPSTGSFHWRQETKKRGATQDGDVFFRNGNNLKRVTFQMDTTPIFGG